MENIIIKSLVNEIERLQAQINDQKQTIFELGDEVDTFELFVTISPKRLKNVVNSFNRWKNCKTSKNQQMKRLLTY